MLTFLTKYSITLFEFKWKWNLRGIVRLFLVAVRLLRRLFARLVLRVRFFRRLRRQPSHFVSGGLWEAPENDVGTLVNQPRNVVHDAALWAVVVGVGAERQRRVQRQQQQQHSHGWGRRTKCFRTTLSLIYIADRCQARRNPFCPARFRTLVRKAKRENAGRRMDCVTALLPRRWLPPATFFKSAPTWGARLRECAAEICSDSCAVPKPLPFLLGIFRNFLKIPICIF